VAKLLLPLLLALAGWALWQAFDRLNDRAAAARHEAVTTASLREAELRAEREANRQDEIRQAARETQTDALRRAREEAIDDSPDPVVAGPAVRAVLRELRTQADQDRRAPR
jgi:hypothetical protein